MKDTDCPIPSALPGSVPVAVALDNSVLGDITDRNIPEGKREDKAAIREILELARKGAIELGYAVTGAYLEKHGAGECKRRMLDEEVRGLLHAWPVAVTQRHDVEIQRKVTCLEKIMQDRGGVDSRIFLVSTLHAKYFLTTDYRFHRRFKDQKKRIRGECTITADVLTPSEFLREYLLGTI
jgi:hypothetical protein